MDNSAQEPEHPPGDGQPRRTRSGALFGTVPASPKTVVAMPLLNKNELSFRRPARDVLFFAEPEADERDGPLQEAMGLLIDINQVFEALDHGFRDQMPLKMTAIDDVMANIITTSRARGAPSARGAREDQRAAR